MHAQFHAIQGVTRELCSEVAALDSCNPFYTFEYTEAMRALGSQPWLLFLKASDHVVGACVGFLRAGRLRRTFEIPSVPNVQQAEIFWAGLSGFCRKQHVTELSVNSFASLQANIPRIPGELSRRTRVEYLLPLANADFSPGVSSNHKRNARKAQAAGVVIERTTALKACQDHVSLQDASMERRMDRGEQVIADAQIRTPSALVDHHAAELFRATRDGKVLSSVLILRAARGAYYHSAGTNHEGMSIGASHYLILRVAETLRNEGKEKFNLGGADASNPGLERFKTGFGCEAVKLEAAKFCVGSRLLTGLNAVVSLVRRLAGARS